MDSGCSRHMTGDASLFSKIAPYDGGRVTFGDKSKKKIIGIGTIGNSKTFSINDAYLVDGLKFNLLSVSQLCDKGFEVSFSDKTCTVKNASDSSTSFCANRSGNVYIINHHVLFSLNECLAASSNDLLCIWHKRLGHLSFDGIAKLVKSDLVCGLPKLSMKSKSFCSACVEGKLTKSTFKSKMLFPLQNL